MSPWIPTVIAAVAALAALGAAAVAIFWARAAWPIATKAALDEGLQRIEAAETKVQSLARQQAEFMEEADGILQAVERKRRRAAASASKVDAEQQDQLAADPAQRRQQLKELARARGIRV